MKTVTRYLAAPQRSIQIAIWLTLAAVLAFAIPGVSQDRAPDAVATAAYTAMLEDVDASSGRTVASSDTLVLADAVSPAGGEAVADFAENPNELLPAYRWRAALDLHTDLGGTEVIPGVQSELATLQFSVAAWAWSLLLSLMNFALSMDIVTSFSHAINNFFATTFNGLFDSGVIAMIGIAAVAMAAMAAFRQKLGQAVKMIVSATLVLGLMQGLGVAATADTGSTADGVGTGYSAPAGTPAWFAVVGNSYVNEISMLTSSVFGATAGITDSIRTGSAGPSDAATGGATCSYYNERLYSTFHAQKAAEGGVAVSSGAALSMVSFMWQRSVYDNWVAANFGNTTEGGRIACHLLERNRGVSPEAQAAIAGISEAGSPYSGMGMGPFMEVTDHVKKNQAAALAWAGCSYSGGSSAARPGWDNVPDLNGKCPTWAKSATPGAIDGGTLGWRDLGALDKDTKAEAPELNKMVRAFYGHNGSERYMASLGASLSTAVYVYAFGGPAVGVMLSQFVLLFMLMLLPWTLLLLALPAGKGGEGRNSTGKKLMRLTAMAFGGKMLFLTVMGVTLTIMSSLFSITMKKPDLTAYPGASAADIAASTSSSNVWGFIIPIVTVVIVQMVLKGLGLGNLMGIGGVMGFATAAVSQGKDGAGVKKAVASATKGGKLQGTLTKGAKSLNTQIGPKKLWSGMKGRAAARALTATGPDGKMLLDDELAAKVAASTMSPWQAFRQQSIQSQGLRPDLAKRVADGSLSYGAAKKLQAASEKRQVGRADERAQARQGEANESTKRLMALAAGADLGATSVDPFAGHVPGRVAKAEINAGNKEARDIANLYASQLTTGEDEWKAWQVQPLGDNFETLQRSTRTDGSTGPLSSDQVTMARIAAQSRVAPELAESVIIGNSGTPALVLPQYTQDGRLFIPPTALSDPKLAAEILSNPLNAIAPELLVRLPGESEEQQHTRLTLTLLDNDLLSPTGDYADILESMGVDRYADGFETQVVQMAQRAAKGNLTELVRVVPSGESDNRVRHAASIIVQTSGEHYADRAGEAIELAVRSAEATSKQVTATVRQVTDLRNDIAVSVSDAKEEAKVRGRLLSLAENESEALLTQVNASIAELQYLAENSAESTPEARAGLVQRIRYIENESEKFRHAIAQQVAAVMHAPDDARDELVGLSDMLTSQFESMARELESVKASSVDKAQAAVAARAQKMTLNAGPVRAAAERDPIVVEVATTKQVPQPVVVEALASSDINRLVERLGSLPQAQPQRDRLTQRLGELPVHRR